LFLLLFLLLWDVISLFLVKTTVFMALDRIRGRPKDGIGGFALPKGRNLSEHRVF
jgi:hypothetical protein